MSVNSDHTDPFGRFPSDGHAATYPDGIENHYWSFARNRIIAHELRRLGTAGRPILDIGCGRGVVLKHLRSIGMEAWGVEPFPVSPLNGMEEYIDSGIQFHQLPEPQRHRIHTLLSLDVIEHIREPIPFLTQAAAAFPNAQHILLTVPAGPSLWSNYDERFGHYRRYTPGMILQLAADLAWGLVSWRYFFHFLFPPLWFMARMKQHRAESFSAPARKSLWLHRLIGHLGIWDDAIIPGRIPGSSLLFILRRPTETAGSSRHGV